MFKPNLILIAGCNGSGKSTYAATILNSKTKIFDADKRKQEIYSSFPFDFDIREQMAWNKTQAEFEEQVEIAIKEKKDFAFETNFHANPLFWVSRFKEAGFKTHLMFFSLKSSELAKERVAIRFQNGGHYVSGNEVEHRYNLGFKNLDKYYKEFNTLLLLESSKENRKPSVLFYVVDGVKARIANELPAYFVKKCPHITKYILTFKKKSK